MEKRKKHYSLDLVKELVSSGNWHTTRKALKNALLDFDYNLPEIEKTILNLSTKDFYKSMTSYYDSSLWQDVYRPNIQGTKAYIKISIILEDTLVVQFKRK